MVLVLIVLLIQVITSASALTEDPAISSVVEPGTGNVAIAVPTSGKVAGTGLRGQPLRRSRPPPPPYFVPSDWNVSEGKELSPTVTPQAKFLTASNGALACVTPGTDVNPTGELCVYQRDADIPCEIMRSRCKWRSECYARDACDGTRCRTKLLAVLPLQGGGTEFMRASLRYRGFDLGGETDGADGTVGWVTACDGTPAAWNFSLSAMKNDGALARLHSRFRYIVHQVRNPIHQIRSNLAFCDPRDYKSWEIVWDFIEALSPGVPYRKANGEYVDCLRRSMLYYITWNRFIETVADFRVRIESPKADLAICHQLLAAAGPDAMPVRVREKKCAYVFPPPKKIDKHTHGGAKRNQTWADVEATDARLAKEILTLAMRYGYTRDEIVNAKFT